MPSDKSHQVREILDSGGSTKYLAHLNQCVARTNEPLPAEHGLVDLYIYICINVYMYICIHVYMYMANWWQKTNHSSWQENFTTEKRHSEWQPVKVYTLHQLLTGAVSRQSSQAVKPLEFLRYLKATYGEVMGYNICDITWNKHTWVLPQKDADMV